MDGKATERNPRVKRKPEKEAAPPVSRSRRFKWLIYITFWVVLVLSFGFLAMAQVGQYTQLQNDLTRLRAETERAVTEHELLQRELQFIGSDAYIEEQARRRLGLVLPTELIFINVGG